MKLLNELPMSTHPKRDFKDIHDRDFESIIPANRGDHNIKLPAPVEVFDRAPVSILAGVCSFAIDKHQPQIDFESAWQDFSFHHRVALMAREHRKKEKQGV